MYTNNNTKKNYDFLIKNLGVRYNLGNFIENKKIVYNSFCLLEKNPELLYFSKNNNKYFSGLSLFSIYACCYYCFDEEPYPVKIRNFISEIEKNQEYWTWEQYLKDLSSVLYYTKSDSVSTTLPVVFLHNIYYDVFKTNNRINDIDNLTKYTFNIIRDVISDNSLLNIRQRTKTEYSLPEFLGVRNYNCAVRQTRSLDFWAQYLSSNFNLYNSFIEKAIDQEKYNKLIEYFTERLSFSVKSRDFESYLYQFNYFNVDWDTYDFNQEQKKIIAFQEKHFLEYILKEIEKKNTLSLINRDSLNKLCLTIEHCQKTFPEFLKDDEICQLQRFIPSPFFVEKLKIYNSQIFYNNKKTKVKTNAL